MERRIFKFGQMILRDRCSTSYDLPSLFHGRRSTLDRWNGNIAKRNGTRPPALHSTCLKEVSQNCFVFDVVNFEVSQNCVVFDVVKFKNCGSLAELLRFLMLSSSKIEEVSQNCCVSSLQTDRLVDR